LPSAETLFVAVYGELTPHRWRDFRVASEDAYSLFHSRSAAMGWLTDARPGALGGLWGMNDAGQDLGESSPPSCVAWFQVAVTGHLDPGQGLPIQPFLSCAADVVSRMGELSLLAVQLLLPLQASSTGSGASLTTDPLSSLLQTTNWFADGDPTSRTRVRVTLDTGRDASIRMVAHHIDEWLRPISQNIFVDHSLVDSDDSVDSDDLIRAAPVNDQLWNGPAQHRIAFDGTLIEWSLDAIGWLAAILAIAGSRHGIRTPMMLTVRRVQPPRR